jgi:hypothetical protein
MKADAQCASKAFLISLPQTRFLKVSLYLATLSTTEETEFEMVPHIRLHKARSI